MRVWGETEPKKTEAEKGIAMDSLLAVDLGLRTGLALYGRGVQFDFEGAVVQPDDGILGRFGLHPDIDQHPLGMVMKAQWVTCCPGYF